MSKKSSNFSTILLVIFLGAVLLFVGYYVVTQMSGSREPVACTLEAKLCPDGSSVGRVGPNCEFAPCPGERQ